MSASVSSAFELTGKEEFEETAKFCRMFDKFFDCLNTRRAGEGKQKRKPDLDPYRSDSDIRLQVSSYVSVWLGTSYEYTFPIHLLCVHVKMSERGLFDMFMTSFAVVGK